MTTLDELLEQQRIAAEAMGVVITEMMHDAIIEERKRILGMMNKRDVGGANPEWALDDKRFQALRREITYCQISAIYLPN